jgi:hypothetical protein
MTPLDKLILQNGIEDLLARFDDAVLRNDREMFRSLWAEDGVWEISAPIPLRAEGGNAIVAALDSFHTTNQFFFRSTSRPVIHADGDRATFRSPTVELARRERGIGYANVAMYFDEARRVDDEWRFVRRYYQYLWVDTKSQLPGEIVSLSERERGGSIPLLESRQ